MSDDKSNKIEKDKTSLGEKAINHNETDGKDINHQVKQRREKHQPRDNA
ncbi:MAG: hypothetical protein WBG48_12205 [Pricia sp.]